MATKEILVELIVAQGNKTLGLSPIDIDKILSGPVFQPVRPKIVSKKVSVESIDTTKPKTPTPNDVVKAAHLGMDVAGKLMDIIRKRAKYFTMTVDPVKQPDLYYACQVMFDDFNGKVTFAQYEEMLRLHRTLTGGLRGVSV